MAVPEYYLNYAYKNKNVGFTEKFVISGLVNV